MTTKFDRKDSSAIHLFDALWPEQGHHFLATRDPATGKFSHNSVSSTMHASEIVLRSLEFGLDVYLAPASFKSGDSRKSDNAIGANSLWMDIDVGTDKVANGSGYATIEAALAELHIFCTNAGIPRPTLIICSGSGLHVYWVINLFIGPKLWLMLATKLKAIAKYLNFRDDPHRTADIASLMRVPGTLNYKSSSPRPVELISTTGTPITLCVMADAITAAHDRLISAQPKKPCKGNARCESVEIALLQAILDCLDPDMTYCDWFRVAAAMFNHSKGSESAYDLFDDWSSRGQKYRGKKDTSRRWKSINPNHPNPTTMATLRMMVEDAGFDWKKDCIAPTDFAPIADREG